MQSSKVRNMVLLSVLAGWAVVLRFFEFPILPIAPYLEVDFSDIPVLIGMLIQGPIGLVTVAFLRDLIQYIMQGGEAGVPIGAIMSFTGSVVMFLPTHFILNHLHQLSLKWQYLFMTFMTIFSLTFVMVLLNYYLALPIYTNVFNMQIGDFGQYIVAITIPFNLIKGLILSIAQILTIQVLSKELSKRHVFFYPNHLNSVKFSGEMA